MTKLAKMMEIKEMIGKLPDFEKENTKTHIFEKGEIIYYVLDNTYFSIKYKGYEVNVYGRVEAYSGGDSRLDYLAKFNLDKWLDEVMEVVGIENKKGGGKQ